MYKHDYKAMIAYCDEATKNGEKLSVTWDGGGDSGWFEMIQDGKKIDDPSGFLYAMYDYIAEYMGYGSFAGDYSTSGELVYDRKSKSFEGIDYYSDTSTDTHTCAIEIRIPNKVWFDRLELRIDAEGGIVEKDTSAQLIVLNGPHIHEHDYWEGEINYIVQEGIREASEEIEDICDINERITIEYDAFIPEGNELVFTVEQFQYSYNRNDERELTIYLTDPNNEDVTI